MVFGQIFEGIVTQHIAGDILRCLGFIERNTGEMVVFIIVVVRAEGHILRRYLRYHTRGHHVIGVNRIEAHEVAKDFILILVHYAFLFADVHHREYFFTTNGGFILIIGEHARDEFDQEHKRIEDIDKGVDGTCREAHQFAPVSRTDHLRYDFTEDQDQQGHASRNEAEPFRTKHLCGLHADTGCSDGVGNRIQR